MMREQKSYQTSLHAWLEWLERTQEKLGQCNDTSGSEQVLEARIHKIKVSIESINEKERIYRA